MNNINDNSQSSTNIVRCVSTIVGSNCISGCNSMIAVNINSECKSEEVVYDLLSFGANNFVCIARFHDLDCDNSKYQIDYTLPGHSAIVRCVRWFQCYTNPSSIWNYPIVFLLSADSNGMIIIWACVTKELINSDNINNWFILCKLQLPGNSVPKSADGYLITSNLLSSNSVNDRLVLSIASNTSIYIWTILIHEKLSSSNIKSLTPCLSAKISRAPSFCLCLRSFCFNAIKFGCLNMVIVGLDNGRMEIWSNLIDENTDASWELTHSATVSGHQDWIRCMDICLDMRFLVPTVLIATGSQDNFIRLWRLFRPSTEHDAQKGILLKFSSNANIQLCISLESVLSSHENWVTGVCWAPLIHLSEFPPALMSSSMDKSLIIWSPPTSSDSSTLDNHNLWVEISRLGNFGDIGMGFLDCCWSLKNNNTVFGLNFQGSISIWQCSELKKTPWIPILPLTGHTGPAVDLTWMKYHSSKDLFDINQNVFNYLLTAGTDQTVRLFVRKSHSKKDICFWYELARPQIHGYDMNAIASISPTLYVSAGDEKVARIFSTTKKFVNSLFSCQNHTENKNLENLFSFDSIPEGAVQPPLGLSNQAYQSTCANVNVMETDETGDTPNTNILDENNTNRNHCSTEDCLQCVTLWPEVKKLYGHPYEVYCLAVHPHKLLIASACIATKQEYAYIILWDGMSDWNIHQRLIHHQLTVTQMSWSHDGTRLLAVSRDRTWSVWSMRNSVDIGVNNRKSDSLANREMLNLPRLYLSAYPIKGQSHSRIIWTCAWSPDDKYFFTGSRDSTICCWSVEVNETQQPKGYNRFDCFKDFDQPITALDICNISKIKDLTRPSYLLAVGLESGSLIFIKLNECFSQSLSSEKPFVWSIILQFPSIWCHAPGKRVRRLAFEPDLSKLDRIRLATAGDDGLVRIFEVERNLIF